MMALVVVVLSCIYVLIASYYLMEGNWRLGSSFTVLAITSALLAIALK